LRTASLLLAFPASLPAQYDAILNNPDVVWAAELTTDFVVEPPLKKDDKPFMNNSIFPGAACLGTGGRRTRF